MFGARSLRERAISTTILTVALRAAVEVSCKEWKSGRWRMSSWRVNKALWKVLGWGLIFVGEQ